MPNPGQEEEAPCGLPKEAPARSRNLWLEPSGRSKERPSLRTQESCRWPARTTARPKRPSLNRKDHMTLLQCSGRWPGTQTSWTEINEVQEVWTGQQGLKAPNHAAKACQRDIQFFCMVTPNESPNIVGPREIHSP